MIETAIALFAGTTAKTLTLNMVSGLIYDVLKFGVQKPGAALRKKLITAQTENRLPTNHTIERGVRRAAICATLTAIEKMQGADLAAALTHHACTPEQKAQLKRECISSMKLLRKHLEDLRESYAYQGWDRPRTQAKLNVQLAKIGGNLTKNEVDKTTIDKLRAQISKTDEGAEATAYAALMLEVVLEIPEWPGEYQERIRNHFAPFFVGNDPIWTKLFPLYFAQEMKDDQALHVILAHQKLDWIEQDVTDAQSDLRAFAELSREQADALMHQMMEHNKALSKLIAFQARQDRVLADILDVNWLLSNKMRAQIEGMFRRPSERFVGNSADNEDDFRQFHFSARGDAFLGRDAQLKRIEDEFLTCPLTARTKAEAFGWMAISGEAGTGKSRLAQEIISRNLGHFRVAGFATDTLLQNPNFGPEHSDAFTHPILIVIDYTAGHQHQIPEFMRGWAEYASHAAAKGRPPVRIILLLRRDDERVLNDIRNLGGNSQNSLLDTGEVFRDDPTMVLEELSEAETLDLMRARIISTAARDPEGRAEVTLSDEELLAKLTSFDEQKRPLFAIIVAHGLQKGTLPRIDGQAGEERARIELFTKYLKSQWVNTWIKRASQKLDCGDRQKSDDMLAQHANLMRVVTACGGTGREPILALIDQLGETERRMAQRFPKTDLAGDGVVEDRVLVSMAGGRGTFNKYGDLDPIPSLEPDLIGECFVMMEPKDFEVQTKLWCHTDDIIQFAWQIDASRTANFLRLMTLDYPRRLHEANWYPCTISDKAQARARARLLRNICLDTSYSCKQRWVTPDEMTRMFDLCDRFEQEMSNYLNTDSEVRRYYGQVLHRASNIAANVANMNLFIDDAKKDAAQTDTDDAIIKRFAGAAHDDEDRATPGGSNPPSDALVKLVVERFALLKTPIMRGIAPDIPFEEREPFAQAFGKLIGSIFWAKRSDEKAGGHWPNARSEEETAELSRLRDEVLDRIEGQEHIDEIATASEMLIAISYAEWGAASIDVYQGAVEAISDTLAKVAEVPPQHAAHIISFAGNFNVLLGTVQKAKGDDKDEVLACLHLIDRIVHAIVTKVVLDETQRDLDIRRYYASGWDMIKRRLDKTLSALKPCPEETQTELVSQAAMVAPSLKLSAGLLSSLTVYLEHLPADGERSPEQKTAFETMFGLVARLIDEGLLEGEGFRIPSFANMPYLLRKWLFRLGSANLNLNDHQAAAFLDLLDRHVGQPAQNEILKSIAGLVPDLPERWMDMPGVQLAYYFAKLRQRNGPSSELSEATLSIWTQLLLSDCPELVLEQVSDLLAQGENGRDADQIRNRTLAMRGISLLASGFMTDADALKTFKSPVVGAQPLGREDAAQLFSKGMQNVKATALVAAHNEALSNAVGSLARIDILAGGDPTSWVEFGENS
nr:hypothetical protein [uncultured Cohaesibacter sp.]